MSRDRAVLATAGRPPVNERTLLPLLMPLAPAATLLERLPSWIDVILDTHRVPRTFIDDELAYAADIGLAKTNSRSVLGVMNEFARLADWRFGPPKSVRGEREVPMPDFGSG